MSSLNDPSIWRFPRKKKKNIILSLIYKIFIAIPLREKSKFELFSNLSWIFKRMAYEFFRIEETDKHIPYNVRNKFIKDKLHKKADVIDLGCGTGDDCRLVAPYVNSVTGIDYDKKKIEIARTLTIEKNETYINREVFEWLSNSNKKYEIIICSHIIEHLDNPANFLIKCKNFFKYIYIEVPDNDQDEHSFLRISSGLEPLYADTDHVWEFKKKDLVSLFNDLELEIINEEHIYGYMRFWLKSK